MVEERVQARLPTKGVIYAGYRYVTERERHENLPTERRSPVQLGNNREYVRLAVQACLYTQLSTSPPLRKIGIESVYAEDQ